MLLPVPRAVPNERTGDRSPFADNDILIIASYVDDLILLCTSRPMLDAFKRRIAADFKMTDMGAMTWCLGMEIVRDRIAGTIRVSQKKYLREVLASHDMRPGMTRSCATPAEVKMRFTADSAPSTKGELRWSENNRVTDRARHERLTTIRRICPCTALLVLLVFIN